MGKVMEECLQESGHRNIFSLLSDEAQSQIGRVERRALDKESASLRSGLGSVTNPTAWAGAGHLRFTQHAKQKDSTWPRSSRVLGNCSGMKVSFSLSAHFQNMFSQTRLRKTSKVVASIGREAKPDTKEEKGSTLKLLLQCPRSQIYLEWLPGAVYLDGFMAELSSGKRVLWWMGEEAEHNNTHIFATSVSN